ncbi:tetratricopeptide repeat protein [Rubinisphaera sp. JC750]|uniref:tetratricopeptide repeat protein n=1 Tax=Rubinisphaera sp. JC750 TaxID=2898658 RepID=UPI001F1D8D7E|nr:tetratricopeptide repeat protein [Rubinisphaera sp. JC750]
MSAPEEIAKQCWQRGSKAINSEDFDYATEMFYKAAVLVPDNLLYRESLRGAEFRKFGENKKGAGMMARPKLMAMRSKIGRARSKKEWDEIDKIAEEALKLNPWDASFNAAAGEACKERGYYHVAIYLYRIATGPHGEPDNIKLLKEFGYLLEENDQFKEAASIWAKVQKLDPNDTEARQRSTAASFQQTIKAGGYDDAEGTRDVMTDKQISDRLGLKDKRKSEADAPGQDPETDLKHQIRKDPENVELYTKLGYLYDSKEKFEEAREAYGKALELSGGDRNIHEMIEDIELKEMSKELEKYKAAAQANPEDEKAQKRVSKYARKLLDREIEVFAERTQRYPQNKRLKYELARRYRKLQRWSDAIPLYQQAGTDPRLELESFFSLGKCFLQDNKPQLALKQFEKIVKKVTFEDKPEIFKEIHYLLGRLYQQAKDKQKSEDHYGEVLAVDYDYRDVRARLQGLEDAS